MPPVRSLICALLMLTPLTVSSAGNFDIYPAINHFIADMVEQHGMDGERLQYWFSRVNIRHDIIDSMNRPGEARPWHVYREQFVTRVNARRGSRFWRKHRKALEQARQQYGVAPEVVLGILGVETQYGINKGGYRVIDTLTTLMLEHKRRGKFFRGELEQFLILCHELKLDPLRVKGSYAGAMGLPQFLPSSYRTYAVDFDGNGRVDILRSTSDAIGSVANYLKQHGWKANEPIIDDAQVERDTLALFRPLTIKPQLALDTFIGQGIFPITYTRPERRAALIELTGHNGPFYRFGFHNFYVITRYNKSTHYAMAVVELSRLVRDTFYGGV